SINTREFRDSALGKATLQAVSRIVADVKNVSLPKTARQESVEHKAQEAKTNEETRIAALRRTPGKVLGTSTTGFVYVSLGSSHGLKSGDKVRVYEVVEDKDEHGTVLGREERFVAELTLESVLEEAKSKAKWDGSPKLMAGWVVKAQ